MNKARNWKSIGFGFAGLFVVLVFWYVYSYNQSSVNLVHGVDKFQTAGVPDFNLPHINTSLDHSKKSTTAPISITTLRLYDIKAKLIIINFWASWCHPCVLELPSLINLAKKYSNEPVALKVVAISIDQDKFALQNFLKKNAPDIPANFFVVNDPSGEVAGQYGTQKIPETYIVNGEYKLIRKSIYDQDWVSPEFLAMVSKWLQ